MASFLLPAAVLAALGALALSGDKKKPAPAPAPPGGGGGGGGGGGMPPLPMPGGGSMPLLSCDQAVSSLPAPMQSTVATMLSAPKTAENASAARKMAIVLQSTAATSAPIEYRQPLLVAAQCLNMWADSVGTAPIGMPTPPNLPGGAGWPAPGGFGSDGGGAPTGPGDLSFPAGVILDKNGVPSSWDGKTPMPGYQSNPLFQWVYTVTNGDSPWAIATAAFGPTTPISRVVELIQYNPVEVLTGRKMQTKGDPMNPNTSGYNFVTLLPGDVLRIPRSWNAWVDQTGKARHGAAPWPPPTSFP